MGLFLSMSGVINKSQLEVETTLTKYTKSRLGGFEKTDNDTLNKDSCVIKQSKNGTTIFYPPTLFEEEALTRFLSKDLNCLAFFFHIHDGDFWMYELFKNGETIDYFCPIPYYFDDNLSNEELEKQKGNPKLISELIDGVNYENIVNYFRTWDLDTEQSKAYPEDEFNNEDWQVVDFMKKIGLDYPVSNKGIALGPVYRFWVGKADNKQNFKIKSETRKWWEFWK